GVTDSTRIPCRIAGAGDQSSIRHRFLPQRATGVFAPAGIIGGLSRGQAPRDAPREPALRPRRARPDLHRAPPGRARPGPAPHHPGHRIAMTIAAKFEIEYLQYLDADGKMAVKLPPAVKDAKALLPLFKQMLYVRTFDTKAIALQ